MHCLKKVTSESLEVLLAMSNGIQLTTKQRTSLFTSEFFVAFRLGPDRHHTEHEYLKKKKLYWKLSRRSAALQFTITRNRNSTKFQTLNLLHNNSQGPILMISGA